MVFGKEVRVAALALWSCQGIAPVTSLQTTPTQNGASWRNRLFFFFDPAIASTKLFWNTLLTKTSHQSNAIFKRIGISFSPKSNVYLHNLGSKNPLQSREVIHCLRSPYMNMAR